MAEQDLNAPVSLPQNIDGVNIHLSYIRRDLESINKKIDTLGTAFVAHEEFSVYKDNVDKRINEMEGNTKWIVRIVVGAVLVSILSLIIINIK